MAADIIFMDLRGFEADIRRIGGEMRGRVSQRDLFHLRKIEGIGRLATFLGFSTAWIFPNPLSAFLIAQGMIVRFIIGHHVGHGAYDHIKDVPKRYTSKAFARGWRRFIDWPDWWSHDAWLYLHNGQHHPNTQDPDDADLMNPNQFVQIWLPVRYLIFAFFTLTWKFSYYALYVEQTWRVYRRNEKPARQTEVTPGDVFDITRRYVRDLWLQRYLPYIGYRFALPTLAFLPLGSGAAANVLLTVILAELIHNAQTFICIRSSHSAPDLPAFRNKAASRGEYFARQVLATANYNGGNDLTDILHGWTNYQIEHHLWPNSTLLQCQRVREEVKAACKARKISYIQETVLKRYWMMSRVFLALDSQRVTEIAKKTQTSQITQ
ncbi:fatty acid desaturase [Pelagibius sp. Alg239-R121]|uniref:fatty acid desaturase family protein n=1 Tax=Pelagibius sp. Alg239-R121 TaxID=2993448 RepID=UPI0024A66D71|nr:fatty acid desaturase [Pelagibius sp. Alg239-R121]